MIDHGEKAVHKEFCVPCMVGGVFLRHNAFHVRVGMGHQNVFKVVKILLGEAELALVGEFGLTAEKDADAEKRRAVGGASFSFRTCSTFCGAYQLEAPGTALSQR